MTFPNILLSGGPKTLLKDLVKAHEAIHDALCALSEATPHGRDYVHLSDWQTAWEEHCARIHAVEKVGDEVRDIISHLLAGGVQ